MTSSRTVGSAAYSRPRGSERQLRPESNSDANATSSRREPTPSFRKTRATRFATVLEEEPRMAAISAFDRPASTLFGWDDYFAQPEASASLFEN